MQLKRKFVTPTTTEQSLVAEIVCAACETVGYRREFRVHANQILAEDAVGEVYIRVLRSIENARKIDSFLNYVRFIATREAIRYFRDQLAEQRKWSQQHLPLNHEIHGTIDVALDPISSDPAILIGRNEQCEEIRRLVARLPERESAVILAKLNGEHGESAVEIAARNLGISRNAGYKLLQTGMNRLRRQMLAIPA